MAVCAREAACHLPPQMCETIHSLGRCLVYQVEALWAWWRGLGGKGGRRQETHGDSGFAETVRLQMKRQTQLMRWRGTNDFPLELALRL